MQRNTLKQCNVQQIVVAMPVLYDRPVGCHVGLVLTNDRGLHLYIDGIDHGVIGTDVLDPCYFMFDLWGYCTKVLCSSFYTKHVFSELEEHVSARFLLLVSSTSSSLLSS